MSKNSERCSPGFERGKNRSERYSKKAFIPIERHETVRKSIINALQGRTLSARDLSGEVRISEKDVYYHLDHIRLAAHKQEFKFIVTPAECRKCGFIFTKRERSSKPGKCPVCRGESIMPPLFSVRNAG